MNTRHVALTALLMPLLLASADCRRGGDAALEELPREIAVNLKPLPGTDLLVSSRPLTVPSPAAPGPGPLPAPKACRTTQEFFSYVLFPVTVCSSSLPFDDVVSAYQSAVTPRTAAPRGAEVKTFKLSSLRGRSLSPFLVCRTRSGPFGATIVKTVECNGATSCTMALHCLGCPPFLWFGDRCESENRPPEVIFIPELTPRPINSSRCPGSLSECGDEAPSPAPPPALH